jgi:hypothetical protein
VKTVCSLLAKPAGSIVATLSCYDRVIFQGYLAFGGDEDLDCSTEGCLYIPRTNPLPKVQRTSRQLVEHAQQMAHDADAAARVLAEAKGPMTCRQIVEAASQKGYWKSHGAMPWATIYSAMIREIAKKGGKSRFKKTGRDRPS